MMEKGISVEEATKKLEYYCSYQDRCYKEVVLKLKSLGMFQTAIDHILNHLSEHKYLDEERFARSFARGKHRFKDWGRHRIEQELKLREISAYNIRTALREIETGYLNHFYDLAEKKWNTIQENSPERKKRKWIDFLMRKGYESHLIFEFLKDLENNWAD